MQLRIANIVRNYPLRMLSTTNYERKFKTLRTGPE